MVIKNLTLDQKLWPEHQREAHALLTSVPDDLLGRIFGDLHGETQVCIFNLRMAKNYQIDPTPFMATSNDDEGDDEDEEQEDAREEGDGDDQYEDEPVQAAAEPLRRTIIVRAAAPTEPARTPSTPVALH